MFAILDPSCRGEISRFGAIETVVESGVVRVGKRNDELAFVLRDLAHGYSVGFEYGRSNDGHLVPKERRTTACQGGKVSSG